MKIEGVTSTGASTTAALAAALAFAEGNKEEKKRKFHCDRLQCSGISVLWDW